SPMAAKIPPTRSPKLRSSVLAGLVELKFLPPVRVLGQRLLARLIEHEVLEHQKVHLRPHEAAVGVRGGADDGLAAYVEGRIDDHTAAGRCLKRLEQCV